MFNWFLDIYPSTNAHVMNLDWFLRQIYVIKEGVKNILDEVIEAVQEELTAYQKKLTAGDGINISSSNVIKATSQIKVKSVVPTTYTNLGDDVYSVTGYIDDLDYNDIVIVGSDFGSATERYVLPVLAYAGGWFYEFVSSFSRATTGTHAGHVQYTMTVNEGADPSGLGLSLNVFYIDK